MIKKCLKEKNRYLVKLKNIVLGLLKDQPVRVIIFGSRARGDNHRRSDVDIGLILYGNMDKNKITLLREKIEDLNIPYKVEIIDFSNTSESFKAEALKEVIVWKD